MCLYNRGDRALALQVRCLLRSRRGKFPARRALCAALSAASPKVAHFARSSVEHTTTSLPTSARVVVWSIEYSVATQAHQCQTGHSPACCSKSSLTVVPAFRCSGNLQRGCQAPGDSIRDFELSSLSGRCCSAARVAFRPANPANPANPLRKGGEGDKAQTAWPGAGGGPRAPTARAPARAHRRPHTPGKVCTDAEAAHIGKIAGTSRGSLRQRGLHCRPPMRAVHRMRRCL